MYGAYDAPFDYAAQTGVRQPARRLTAMDHLVFAAGVFALFIYSLAWAAPLTHYSYKSADSGVLRSMSFPAYGACLFLLVLAWERVPKVLLQNFVLLLLLALVTASCMWSIDPATTLRRSIALCCITASGLALAVKFSWEDLSEVLATSFGIVAVMSLLLGALYPAWGRMHELFPGAWRGAYLEKNGLGGMMSSGVLLMAGAAIYAPRRRLLWLGGMLLCLLLVVLCRSKTALLCVLLGAAFLGLVWTVRRGPVSAIVSLWLAGAVLLSIIGLFIFAPDIAFKAVGKDATLTGRTQIWGAALRQWSDHRWLGFGYGVLWLHPEHWYPAAKIFKEAKFQAGHAHNGWLEVALGTGLAGLSLWTLFFLQVWGRAFMRLFNGGGAYLVLPFFAMFTLRSATEVSILDYGDILWCIFVAFGAKLALDPRRIGTNAA